MKREGKKKRNGEKGRGGERRKREEWGGKWNSKGKKVGRKTLRVKDDKRMPVPFKAGDWRFLGTRKCS